MKDIKELIVKDNPFSKNDLEKNFDEELNNNTFKKIVNTLDLPKKELIKYTSLIKDSVNELEHCKNCKNIMECKNAVNGYVYYPEVSQDNLIFTYRPCKYKKAYDKETEFYKNVTLIDMPRELLAAKMKDIYTDDNKRLDAVKWISTFIKKYRKKENCNGLYLNGNFGCGKTYLVSACFNELAKDGTKVAIVYYPDFLRKLKENFDNASYLFNNIKNTDLLLLDDIGAETTTNWNRDEILGTILQHRMQSHLPTFFTSNLTIDELEKHLATNDIEGKLKARRIIERIKYLTDNIVMIAENRRK